MKKTGRTAAAIGLMLLAMWIMVAKFSTQNAQAAVPLANMGHTAPASACDICNAYFSNVTATCQPDGTVHWTATVTNNDDCTTTSGYNAMLLVQRNYGNYNVVINEHHGAMNFPPGDTTFSGDFNYAFPPDATGAEVIIQFDTSGQGCGFREGKSGVFNPCEPGNVTPTDTPVTDTETPAPPTDTPTNTPPRHATNTPTNTFTPLPSTATRTPVPPTNTRTPTRTATVVPATRTPAPTNTPQPSKHRMTGGGHIDDGGANRDVSHGFELRCDATDHRQNLEVNWEGGNKFHLTDLTSAMCFEDPNFSECPPCAGFNTFVGSGVGLYDGVAGAHVDFTFTDAGEPGRNDHFDMTIVDVNGNTVLSVSGFLDGGNHQAHK